MQQTGVFQVCKYVPHKSLNCSQSTGASETMEYPIGVCCEAKRVWGGEIYVEEKSGKYLSIQIQSPNTALASSWSQTRAMQRLYSSTERSLKYTLWIYKYIVILCETTPPKIYLGMPVSNLRLPDF